MGRIDGGFPLCGGAARCRTIDSLGPVGLIKPTIIRRAMGNGLVWSESTSMRLRNLVLFSVKIAICLAYLSNVVSIAGLAPLFVFAPFLLGMAIVLLLTERSTPAVSSTSKLLSIVTLAMILSALLTPVFFGFDGNRPRAVLTSTVVFSTVLILARVVRDLSEIDSVLSLIRWLTVGLVGIGLIEVLTG